MSFSMLGTKRFHFSVKPLGQFLTQVCRVKGPAAYLALYKRHGSDLLPSSCEHVPKLDRLLWTDSPTIAASRAKGHVMKEMSFGSLIPVVEGTGWTVLHTGKASITPVVDSEEGHDLCHLPAHDIVEFVCGFHHSRVLKVVRFHVAQGARFAGADALRISSAEVTLESHTEIRIETHGACRTG
jgi:hypothetical protein